MKYILLYFPYELGDLESGSGVRPIKIAKYFKQYFTDSNISVLIIKGERNERKPKIKELIKNLHPNDILFCYIENSTMPIWFTDQDHIPRYPCIDLKLFKFLKENKIPTGLFYRDIYWKFKEEYPVKGFKRFLLVNLYRLELFIYKKYITHFFLPSIYMNKYVGFKTDRVTALPPGGEIVYNHSHYVEPISKDEYNAVYVGGISERYGLKDMLIAFNQINNMGYKINLHLVCRRDEFINQQAILSSYLSSDWLHIYHVSGEDLQSVYTKADFSIIPRKVNEYNDFAVPVKLFEYLSYELPVLATNCRAQKEIIENDDLGLIVKSNPEDIAQGIIQIANPSNLLKYKKNIKNFMVQKGTWLHRVKTIYEVLDGYR